VNLPLSGVLCGDRVALRAPRLADAPRLVAIRKRSSEFLEPWVSTPSPEEFDLAAVRARVAQDRRDFRADRHYRFCITLGAEGEIIGRVALSQVFRGVFQNAYLGYWIDVEHQGQGYTTEAVRLCLDAAFGPLALHRVQAAIMPRNEPSLAVAHKAGLRLEGRAARYLKIAGKWEDHLIFAVTADEWRSAGSVVVRKRKR
jgi:ribosomal-protein-alanine N-acetyltransferase